ncbi:BTB/POZ domain-containing protein 2-like [Paramacrobiotus metropolitanus]|uniref:BTB/POZ domain-containing protein 2-like n=1 Tax=Paramacrobiotus metropolitanus TaxID=2943436 RepID=UPI002446021A|nr:BTB/POZ domain-containing protein 2-like [Paramacrobiotus metropolitanus]
MAKEKDWHSSKRIHKRTAYLLDHPDSEIPSDITFVVGDGCSEPKKTFKCHKFILALVSSVFQAMFYGNFEQVEVIELPDISPLAFDYMLQYAYADDWTFADSEPLANVMQTLYCAKKYLIRKLMRACRDHVQSHVNYSDAADVMQQARLLGEDDLAEIALEEIRRCTSLFLDTEEFLSLPLDSVKEILDQNNLDASEPKIYQSVCRWIKHNVPSETTTLRERFGSLFRLIRFPAFTPVELSDGPIKDGLLTTDEVYNLFQYYFATPKPAVPFLTTPRKAPAEGGVLQFTLDIPRTDRDALAHETFNDHIAINLRPDLAPECVAFLEEIVGGNYALEFREYPNEHSKECTRIPPVVVQERNPFSHTIEGACWLEWTIKGGKVCNLNIAAWREPTAYHSAVFGFVDNKDAVDIFTGFDLWDNFCPGGRAINFFLSDF